MGVLPFSEAELEYLASQRIGRLATVAPDGAPQNNPVGLFYNDSLGTIDIRGLNLSASRKFRNVLTNSHVALVVDDVVSVEPWEVRGIEIRGVAEALIGSKPRMGTMSRQVIRIYPRRIISWNVDPARRGMEGRDVTESPRVA
jgi:pyridoxamine 5'-phosphate oxidase family protein